MYSSYSFAIFSVFYSTQKISFFSRNVHLKKNLFFLFILLLLSSCSSHFTHFSTAPSFCDSSKLMKESDFFLVILVDAPNLNYNSCHSTLKTIAQHPNGSTRGDVGHAWILLKGVFNNEPFYLEGGHSGELGIVQPRYFDGVMNYVEYGVSYEPKNKKRIRYEKNPIKYLWETQKDGFFQEGNGIHTPTSAIKIDLTEKEFHKILHFIKYEYDYKQYRLTDHQCCTFVAEILNLLNLNLIYEVTLNIPPSLFYRGVNVKFHEDPNFSLLKFGSPDRLQKSLIDLIEMNKAEYALKWYKKNNSKSGRVVNQKEIL